MMQKKLRNQVRIIGGQWRSRKITFPDHAELRPTPDRVRETLFNWLTKTIQDSRCLDAFAGSGVLGFEALSRGAREVVMIENNREAIGHLKNIATVFNATDRCTILEGASPDRFFVFTEPFDIIFLDPPFSSDLLLPCLSVIANQGLLSNNGVIYIESAKPISELPNDWQILKEKRAGQVFYYLISVVA